MRCGKGAQPGLAAIAVAILLAASAARAQAPRSPLPLPLPPPVETEAEISALAQFLKDNPGCREMTDACQVCSRSAGRISCTTPGIACVKQGWRCTAPAAEGSPPQPK